MKIYVDADACPVKQEVERVATRNKLEVFLVSNGGVRPSLNPLIQSIFVSADADAADKWIVDHGDISDLVITSDIPLAAEVLEEGAFALSPRGEKFTENNIKQILNMRDFMDTMRSSGVEMSGGPAKLNSTDKQTFANALDSLLAQHRS